MITIGSTGLEIWIVSAGISCIANVYQRYIHRVRRTTVTFASIIFPWVVQRTTEQLKAWNDNYYSKLEVSRVCLCVCARMCIMYITNFVFMECMDSENCLAWSASAFACRVLDRESLNRELALATPKSESNLYTCDRWMLWAGYVCALTYSLCSFSVNLCAHSVYLTYSPEFFFLYRDSP